MRVRLGERDIQKYLANIVSGKVVSVYDKSLDTCNTEQLSTSGEDLISADEDVIKVENTPTASNVTVVIERENGGSNSGNTALDLGFEPNEEEQRYIIDMAHRIYRVLQDIGVRLAGPVDPSLADVGPALIRYKLKLTTGEKVATLQNRSRDLMRELAISKEPMVDNLPGTNFVYIDVPRMKRQPARLLPYLRQCKQPESADRTAQLVVPIGVSPAGEVEWLDILSLPHMLVAGSTGSGKTMFLYTLIISLVTLYSHQDVELVLVDPKETDFVFFNHLRHVRHGTVLTDPQEAVEVLLELLTHEVEGRTAKLRETYSRDIRTYNRRYPDDIIRPIVVVIDEFADLADTMGDRREDFDTALRRLSQRARNVGIHLVVSTQRPTTDIVNGTLKSNLPCRVSFRLASAIDSRTILDQGGAQNLLGEGDMLVSWNGEMKRLQGFYSSEDEILEILEPLRVR